MKFEGIATNDFTDIEFFPNPFTNEFTISNAEKVQKIIITNTLGQIVKEEVLSGVSSAVISTQNLQQGVYFITLKSNEGFEVTKKVIKID